MNSSFPTTQWSLVLAVGDPRLAQDALATLCEAYWFPLYGYVRRRGVEAGEAQDLTQAFFVHLLERHAIARADPERGRFRAFLRTALRNFLGNHWERGNAAKRGGGERLLSLDFAAGESRLHLEPSHTETPEAIFDREWALALFDVVMRRLHAEQATPEKAALFAILKPFLAGATAGWHVPRSTEGRATQPRKSTSEHTIAVCSHAHPHPCGRAWHADAGPCQVQAIRMLRRAEIVCHLVFWSHAHGFAWAWEHSTIQPRLWIIGNDSISSGTGPVWILALLAGDVGGLFGLRGFGLFLRSLTLAARLRSVWLLGLSVCCHFGIRAFFANLSSGASL